MLGGAYDSFKEKQLYAHEVHFLGKTLSDNIIVRGPETNMCEYIAKKGSQTLQNNFHEWV